MRSSSSCAVRGALAECAQRLLRPVQLDVELKTPVSRADVIDVLRDKTRAKWRRRDFVLTSFDESMIEKVRVLDRYVRTGLLLNDRPDSTARVRPLRRSPNGFSRTRRERARKDELDRAAEQRVPLVPWTVNDPSPSRVPAQARIVAGVITDDVAVAVEVKRSI